MHDRSTGAQAALTTRLVDIGQLRLHVAEAGDPSAPLVVLLHGFPEHWYAWRHQIPALAAAGLRVIAPDLRGYNLSDKPAQVSAYSMDAVAGDIARLIRTLGHERAHLVGHDWGGTTAWTFAMRYPDLLDRLVVINAPHPERFARAFRDPRQLARSAYVLPFQLPWLPEAMLRAGGFRALRRVLERQPTRAGAYSLADLDRYMAAWSRPGALTGGLNYYRAAMREGPRAAQARVRPIESPTLVIWGERDAFLGPDLAEPDSVLVPNCRVARLPDASHWVMADEPERLNDLLAVFLDRDAWCVTRHAKVSAERRVGR